MDDGLVAILLAVTGIALFGLGWWLGHYQASRNPLSAAERENFHHDFAFINARAQKIAAMAIEVVGRASGGAITNATAATTTHAAGDATEELLDSLAKASQGAEPLGRGSR